MEFSVPVEQGMVLFQKIRDRFPDIEFHISTTAKGLYAEETAMLEAHEKSHYLAQHTNRELLDDLITRQHASDDPDYQLKGTIEHLSQTSLCLARRLDRTRTFDHTNWQSADHTCALFAWRHVVETLNYLARPYASPASHEMEKLAAQLLAIINQSGMSFEPEPQIVDLGARPARMSTPAS